MAKALGPIDRSAFEPPYSQLARQLRERVASGEFQPGDRLPSEAELCDAYQVSPMTVRRAVTQLVRDGSPTPNRVAARSSKRRARRGDLRPCRPASLPRGPGHRSADPRGADRCAEHNECGEKLAVDADEHVIAIKRLLDTWRAASLLPQRVPGFRSGRPLVEAELGVTSLHASSPVGAGSALKYGRLTLHASALTRARPRIWAKTPGPWPGSSSTCSSTSPTGPQSWGRFICRSDRLASRLDRRDGAGTGEPKGASRRPGGPTEAHRRAHRGAWTNAAALAAVQRRLDAGEIRRCSSTSAATAWIGSAGCTKTGPSSSRRSSWPARSSARSPRSFSPASSALPVKRTAGTFVIATVKGDIHDIGKNIAGRCWSPWLHRVDLGVDVPSERIAGRRGAEPAGGTRPLVPADDRLRQHGRDHHPCARAHGRLDASPAYRHRWRARRPDVSDQVGADGWCADAARGMAVVQRILGR